MYWYIKGFRMTVLYGQVLDANTIIVCALCAVIALVLGLIVFRSQQDKFVLHI